MLLDQPLQNLVLAHGHDVINVTLYFQKVEKLRASKPTVEADTKPGLGKSDPQPFQRSPEGTESAELAGALPGRSTAAERYCSASSLKVRKPRTGK